MSDPAHEPELFIDGFVPGAPAHEMALLRTRVFGLVHDLARRYPLGPFELRVGTGRPAPARGEPRFVAIEPQYTLDRLALPPTTRDQLFDCLAFARVSGQVFDAWGLRGIEPHPSLAANFRGPPGTGKTMAAHAAAHHLGKKLLTSRLSDLESPYHGQGPRHLVELFAAARRQGAVLFLDEAEALLSRRFAQPQQAAESAINAMRTELFMALDEFDGLVIFASNLPASYDAAMESRLVPVDFCLPDEPTRAQIWRHHLPPSLPTGDVSTTRLAAIDGVSGRDIKMAVISAAVHAARTGLPAVDETVLAAHLRRRRVSPLPDLHVPPDQLRDSILEAGMRIDS